MSIHTVAILGAGHGGCAAAADLGGRGFAVRLHARNPLRLEPLRARGGIEARGLREGFVPIPVLTTDLAEAVDGADLIMLVVPGSAHADYAAALAPLLAPDRLILLNPGHTGGGLHFRHELRRAGYRDAIRTVETVSLTYICRMEGPAAVGIYAALSGKIAALPGREAASALALIRPLYPMQSPATSVIETALANMNATFHPPGMLMNAGWIESTGGDFLFYRDGMTEAIGKVCSAIDGERLAIARALGVPAASFLDTFYAHGATTEAARASGSIARACRESEPNRTIKSPPSLDHRYVHEDVGYGLVPMAALGRLAGVATPTIDALVALITAATGIDYAATGLTLEKMGLAGRRADELAGLLADGT